MNKPRAVQQATTQADPIAGKPDDETAAAPNLRKRVVSGSAWAAGGFIGENIVRLATNVIMTRLLLPDMFGLVAIVMIFVQGLRMFSDVGIIPAIVQNPRGDDRRFLDTAWTIQVIRGIGLWAVSLILAWPVAAFYGQVELQTLLPIAALNAVAMGLFSTNIPRLNRHLLLGRETSLRLGTQLLTGAGNITWALISPTALALVVPGVVANFLMAAVSHFILPKDLRNGQTRSDRLGWDRAAAAELVTFGKWIFLSTALAFLMQQSDRLVFGKLITLEQLGVYSIALGLAVVPTKLILWLGQSVAFPALSRCQDKGRTFDKSVRRLRVAMLVAGALLLSGMFAAGPPIVRLMYADAYHGAAWILQWLAIGGWFMCLASVNGPVLLARGRSRELAFSQAAKLVAMLVLLFVGYRLYGFVGAVAGLAVSEAAGYAVSTLYARRETQELAGIDARLSAAAVATAAVAWLAGDAAAGLFHTPLAADAAHALVAAAIVLAAWALPAYVELQRARGRNVTRWTRPFAIVQPT